jgi:hypothetical protein
MLIQNTYPACAQYYIMTMIIIQVEGGVLPCFACMQVKVCYLGLRVMNLGSWC